MPGYVGLCLVSTVQTCHYGTLGYLGFTKDRRYKRGLEVNLLASVVGYMLVDSVLPLDDEPSWYGDGTVIVGNGTIIARGWYCHGQQGHHHGTETVPSWLAMVPS